MAATHGRSLRMGRGHGPLLRYCVDGAYVALPARP